MRLYIYDEQEYRHGRHDADDGIAGAIRAVDTVKLPISNLADLHSGLARLVSEGKKFTRVLWMTHGTPGSIYFGSESISSNDLRGPAFVGKGYERLFPKPTKMYFSGCNVAGDTECDGSCNAATRDAGWRFLESVGSLFLNAGGYTMAWTSTGRGWNSKAIRLLISSHSLHFSGDVRIVTFTPRGIIWERLSYDGGLLSGDFYKEVIISAKLKGIMDGGD